MRTGDCLHRVEKAIIIAPATTQTMACGIESDTRDKSNIDETIVGERFADGFHDAKGPYLKVVRTCIVTEFHAGSIQDLWQKDGLTFGYEIIDKLMGTDLIWQGIVGHDGLSLGEAVLQTGDNGL